MPAILPSLNIDSDAAASRYFLPYQLTWIADDSRMRLAEKSVRIGWTWADAFKNVRKRLRHTKRDYLFATKDQASAFEYADTCKQFCEIFNLTKSILSHGVDEFKVPIFKDGKDSGFTEEVKVGYIKFDNGSRILAFSSNPNAMRVFGGDVGLDEYAYHPNAEALWATAQGRITWGYDLGMWSSHNGSDTQFNVFAGEAQRGLGGWTHYRVTMEDALALGLLEKINQVSGKNWTAEEFITDCKNRARLPEVYEQAYNCNPAGSTSAIVSWATIANCLRDYKIERHHFEAKQIVEQFGAFVPERQTVREQQIANFIRGAFPQHFARAAHHAGGFDVAASGAGDLASIYFDEKTGGALDLRTLFTCRTDDWNFLQTVLFTFLRGTASAKMCGDETGLGRQICWEASKYFDGQFFPVNFSRDKHDMGFALMNQLSVAEKRWPRDQQDITADFFALRKIFSGGRWHFSEGSNAFNPHSHCDIAWGGGLATKAAAQGDGGYGALFV